MCRKSKENKNKTIINKRKKVATALATFPSLLLQTMEDHSVRNGAAHSVSSS